MKDFLQYVATNEVYLYPETESENELGNLITTLMMDAVPTADFVIINAGGLRTQWYPGIIQYQHFYNMFPFENTLITFDITGSELIALLAAVQKGPLGFYPTAGLQITASTDRSKNHAFIGAKFYNKLGELEDIVPDRVYRGMSNDFLLEGGDDFKNAMGKVYTLRKSRA